MSIESDLKRMKDLVAGLKPIPARIECSPPVYWQMRAIVSKCEEGRNPLFGIQVVEAPELPAEMCVVLDGDGKRIETWYRGDDVWYIVDHAKLEEQLKVDLDKFLWPPRKGAHLRYGVP